MTIPVRHRAVVGTSLKAAAAVGVPGAFTFAADYAGLGVVWAHLIYKLARASGHDVDLTLARGVARSMLGAVRLVAGRTKFAPRLLRFVPGPGTILSIGISAALNMLYTLHISEWLVRELEAGEVDWEALPGAIADELARLSWLKLLARSGEAWTLATTFGGDLPPVDEQRLLAG